MFRSARPVIVLSLLTVLGAMIAPQAPALAQEAGGALNGTVAVAGPEPVANAVVVARHQPSGREMTTRTAADGTWTLTGLEQGDWLLVISAAGLADAIERVVVRTDGPVQVRTAMHLRAVQEQVTVTATKTERDLFLVPSEVSVVGRQELDNVQARSLDDAVRYLPNVEMGATRRQLQAANIRGFDDRRVLVLRDGARIAVRLGP